MSISNKMIIKSKSSSLKYDRSNVSIFEKDISSYTQNGFVTQNSSNNMTRKSSFKHKFISLFRNYSKLNQKHESVIIENNARGSLTRDSSQVDSSRSTLSNTIGRTLPKNLGRSHSPPLNDFKERLSIRDKQLIEKFHIHPDIDDIIACITEQPCSTIKLPSSWIVNMGSHLSNRVLQPFLTSIPGLIGLKNHGNTCYVNVIIQCLAHIDSVAQYFATKDYLVEIRQSQEQSDHGNASSLDVLVSMSYLLQSLWQHTYHHKISNKFCQMLTLHNTQFSIDSQQDAHEFLLCVLNLLHDNLARHKSKTEDETSFIYDIFRGWLSNEIKCPKCGDSRKHRDQMLSLNLQIPKGQHQIGNSSKKFLFSIVVIDSKQTSQRHAFEVDASTTVSNIRNAIAGRLSCLFSDIIVLEMVDSGFGKLYSDSELLTNLSVTNNFQDKNSHDNFENGLYAVYIPNQVVDVDALPVDVGSEDEANGSVNRQKDILDSQPFIRLLVVHVEKNKYSAQEYLSEINEQLRRHPNIESENSSSSLLNINFSFTQKHFRRFTNILTVQAARKTKLSLLRQSLSEQMIKHLNLRNVTKLPKPQFLIEGSHLVSEMDMYPLSHSLVAMALRQNAELCGTESAVVRLLVVWPFRTTHMLRLNRRTTRDSNFLSNNINRISLHSSVDELSAKYNASASTEETPINDTNEPKITINDCLREFFSLDSVSVTEPWNCPSCQSTQQAHTNIRIEQAPEILILMLKRFSNGQTPTHASTVNNQRIVARNESLRRDNSTISHQNGSIGRPRKNGTFKREDSLNKLECFIDYPLENLDLRNYMESCSDDDSYLYNLEGVVNHRGSLSNGHYVATCKNSIDDRWRLYDDDRVKEISKSEVVSPDAYILFYKRQSKSTEPIADLHWSYRRLAFPNKIHRNQSPNPTSLYSKHRRFSDRDTVGNSRAAYATLPLTVSNNHNSIDSLTNHHHHHNHRLTCIDEVVTSPYLASSSTASLPRHVDYEEEEYLDIGTIVSSIVDLANDSSTSSTTVCSLDRSGSNESDSGTACSRHTHKHSGYVNTTSTSTSTTTTQLINNDGDECYCSLSGSPYSSPIPMKKTVDTIVSVPTTDGEVSNRQTVQ